MTLYLFLKNRSSDFEGITEGISMSYRHDPGVERLSTFPGFIIPFGSIESFNKFISPIAAGPISCIIYLQNECLANALY